MTDKTLSSIFDTFEAEKEQQIEAIFNELEKMLALHESLILKDYRNEDIIVNTFYKIKKKFSEERSQGTQPLRSSLVAWLEKRRNEVQVYVERLKSTPYHDIKDFPMNCLSTRCDYCSVQVSSIVPLKCELKKSSIERHEAKIELLDEMLGQLKEKEE